MISKDKQSHQGQLDLLIDQVCGMIQTGAEIDIDRLAEENPEFSQQLRELYPTLVALTKLESCPDSDRSDPVGSEPDPFQTLGDFQLLRQIGRGGMGVVYEAQQQTIRRKVAIKILPFAALIDSRALQRFKNEVTAVATLEHPHIVSVYSIGEERGIHYYAMQLVHGQDLAAVIRELRRRAMNEESVTGESLMQLVANMSDKKNYDSATTANQDGEDEHADAAETLARGKSVTFASQVTDRTFFRNVARLMIQACDALHHAHDHGIVHRDVKPGNLLLDAQGNLIVTDFGLARMETAPGLTMTGDVLGTLRYMSPEQVLADRVVIDHRTDIYSLGATLYELLTLTPIWADTNKADLVRRISFEEPIAPRRQNSSIPTDLETIVLKAISKNPNDRYDNIEAMGADLQNYLDHKSIVAKRPTLAQHISKWTRRNPLIVTFSLMILLLTTVGLVVSNVLILQQKRITDSKAREVQQQSLRAERNLDRALMAVNQLLIRVGAARLLNTPQAEQLRKQLLEDALRMCESIVDLEASNPEAMRRNAEAIYSLATIDAHLGNKKASIEGFRQSIDLWLNWLEQFPNHPSFDESEALLARSYQNLGVELKGVGDAELVIENERKSIAIRERLVDRASGQVDPELRLDLAMVTTNHGATLKQMGKLAEAETMLQKAIGRFESLVKDHGDKADYHVYHAWALGHYSELLRDSRDFSKAAASCQQSLVILEKWSHQAKDQGWAKLQLVSTMRDRAGYLKEDRDTAKAKLLIERAINEGKSLLEIFPGFPVYSIDMCKSLEKLADIQSESGDFVGAVGTLKDSIDIARSNLQAHPSQLGSMNRLSDCLNNLAVLQYQAGDRQAGEVAMLECIKITKQMIEMSPKLTGNQQDLALFLTNMGDHMADEGQFDRAASYCREGITVINKLITAFPDDLRYLERLVRLRSQLAVTYIENQKYEESKAELIKGMPLVEQLATANPQSESSAKSMLQYRANLAVCHAALGDFGNAEKVFLETVDVLNGMIEKFPHQPTHRENLSVHHSNLGKLYNDSDRFELAEKHYGESLKVLEDLAGIYPGNAQITLKVLQVHSMLGEVCRRDERSNDAESHWLNMLELSRKKDVPRESMRALENLAYLHCDARKYADSIKYFEQRNEILGRELGSDHPQTLGNLYDLALALKEIGEMDEASTHFREIVKVRSQIRNNHPDDVNNVVSLGGAHTSLGNIYWNSGDIDSGEDSLLTAIEILEDAAPRDSSPRGKSFLHVSYLSLGNCFHSQKRYDQAIVHFNQAADDPAMAGLASYNLACAFALKGSIDEAFSALAKAVENGFRDAEHIEKDPDLDRLREDPRYQDIIDKLASDQPNGR